MNRTYPKWQDEQTDWDADQTDKDVHMGTCDKERYSYWPSYAPFSTSFAYFETRFLFAFPLGTGHVLFRSVFSSSGTG